MRWKATRKSPISFLGNEICFHAKYATQHGLLPIIHCSSVMRIITDVGLLVRTMVLICVGVSTKTMDCINWKLTSELPFVAVSKWGLVRSLSYGISFIHTQISVHLHVNKTNFLMKDFTPGLALRRRWKATRKLPIILMGRKETWRKSFPISLGLLLCGFRANKSVIIPCGILT